MGTLPPIIDILSHHNVGTSSTMAMPHGPHVGILLPLLPNFLHIGVFQGGVGNLPPLWGKKKPL